MIEMMRTNDLVLISFAEALLTEAGIGHFVADSNMSIIEGSLGVLPRRLMVDKQEARRAHRILTDAGLEHELRPTARPIGRAGDTV
ncbi:DUF2007 domain-containing protein [Phyllobacterium leguminum]|uniref:Putative signal transducing protein n=1 Tax=Phyllobacterium leguminum TaxID=314237 RepID=A0A318TBF5_9HYPH|nr:DUF2007 domain-containing protein [Phyllobacterium leguminum]PYE90565.1 putative signal transducing protein [Phyllobacterium leguminum]